jgi:serine acetyltransferase
MFGMASEISGPTPQAVPPNGEEMIGFFKFIREDIQAVFEQDPAARSRCEVFLCYPGLHVVWMYRLSHWLWQRRLPVKKWAQ